MKSGYRVTTKPTTMLSDLAIAGIGTGTIRTEYRGERRDSSITKWQELGRFVLCQENLQEQWRYFLTVPYFIGRIKALGATGCHMVPRGA